MLDVFLILFFAYISVFIFALLRKNNSWADVFWGLGFVAIVLSSFIFIRDIHAQHIVVTLLIMTWGLRLAIHLGLRTVTKKSEDPRYGAWRVSWKNFTIRSFLQVYMLQMIFMVVIATPIWMLFFFHFEPLSTSLTLIGAMIAMFGLIYEIIADTQLQSFLSSPRTSGYMSSGLRALHRYPQYFGESVFWFGISFIAAQIHIIAFLGWAAITFTLVFLSGIAMSEARNKNKAVYKKYKKEVPSTFLPDLRKIKL